MCVTRGQFQGTKLSVQFNSKLLVMLGKYSVPELVAYD